MHKLWELSLPFLNMFSASLPRGRIFHELHDLFPGIPDDAFTLHRHLKLHGGSACSGDVVAFSLNGAMDVGRLKLAVGINVEANVMMFAVIEKWALMSVSDDRTLHNYQVVDDIVCIPTMDLDTILLHRMVDDGRTCAIFVPWELRNRITKACHQGASWLKKLASIVRAILVQASPV